ncbi:hypothetical protein P152DRAFT_454593 [Eremomyces bilateralis CBS 781.70]|uniref:Uncharacterized protein n=1 Tax=Eremomyces bilateralis CBS 781.70 TaxID=1392243 RepID=A0A6G1GEK3_9PEZI|nr:uncharacterized protein P152DRAFT_454593 [Eremomyces bilateralis CBS 781.70]KAF1816331.1 hypothetical protein P152DRAFT_454593 [Eremomyces bilateralis CBS 781.70]
MAEPQNKTYSQRTSEQYQKQKDSWMPWIEDLYLRWFTKDNKASYATKGIPIPSQPNPCADAERL